MKMKVASKCAAQSRFNCGSLQSSRFRILVLKARFLPPHPSLERVSVVIMTNAPDRMELVVLPDDVSKIIETKETKLSDGNPVSVFRVNCEDHTLGNILRLKLLENEQVLFAGYRVEHPLDRHVKIRVQTVADITPCQAVESALFELEKQFRSFQDNLKLSHGSAAAANL